MIKIGMMIGNRYEILEKIGTGGMSDVYKAKCHTLNRYVAVKVLKQEFSENANFVAKFRVEAQAAAGLMHPNIVNVYDVGEENGMHYIVMELVEGITLKKYIEKKQRLSYKESVSIAIQICMGINAAHNNHIIHRDIKPQNIIISRDGKVKVTDFGIAKAATSNTITSNVMGSVHYTSPEQARGGYSDEKSDIYSLGITLFEMLTGRVPFNGETTVAIAIKHIQEEMVSPREFVDEIPAPVESIVLKCCQKSPDRRYQSMPELIADLKQSLMNPDEDFVVQNDPDIEGSTRTITEQDVERIKKAATESGVPMKTDTMRINEYHGQDEEDDGEYDNGDSEYDYNPKMERLTTILAVVAGIVLIIIVIILFLNLLDRKGGNDRESSSPIVVTSEDSSASVEQKVYVEMPLVKGMKVEDARNSMADRGLRSEVSYEESDTVEAGIIFKTEVEEGASVEKGSTVKLVASAGPQGIDVPNTIGSSYAEALDTLEGLGFGVTKVEAYSDTTDVGLVAAQNPNPNSRVAKGTNITLTVSLGKEALKTKVPNILGISEMDGTAIAYEYKLSIGSVANVYSNEYGEGLICYQSIPANTSVDQNTPIDIKVSLGPEPKTATYKYNGSIASPIDEDPAFVAGSPVTLKLTAANGTVLLETTVTSFPYSANFSGIASSTGTLVLTYEVTGAPTIDEEGNTVPGAPEKKSLTRNIEFATE